MDNTQTDQKKPKTMTLADFGRVFKEVQPQLKEDLDKLMNEEVSDDWKKLMSRQ